jgi:hypothetical protein
MRNFLKTNIKVSVVVIEIDSDFSFFITLGIVFFLNNDHIITYNKIIYFNFGNLKVCLHCAFLSLTSSFRLTWSSEHLLISGTKAEVCTPTQVIPPLGSPHPKGGKQYHPRQGTGAVFW